MDAYTKAMLRLMTAAYPDLGGTVTDAEVAREIYAKALFPPGREVAAVENRMLPGGIPVRVYRPRTEERAPGVVVYFHGGGFVLCDLDTHDGVCRLLADDASVIVVSVDYRRAPEHPYPAAPDDAFRATCWVREHLRDLGGDPDWLAVAGDSAGGALAAVTCLRARDTGVPVPDFQLLVYPVTDCFADRTENGEGYLLTERHMRWYVEQYLADPADGDEPYASPLRAPDLTGLPPALVITAEYDPLRAEGSAYGKRLAEAGVPAVVHEVAGLFHGPFGLGGLLPVAREAEIAAAGALREAFRSRPGLRRAG